MPPDDLNPVTFGSFGFICEDSITWTPVGHTHIDSQESTFCCESDDAFPDVKDLLSTSETMTFEVSFVDDAFPDVKDLLSTSEIMTFKISFVNYKWLRRLLGYMRLDYVWAYRRERKGHPRCRRKT